MFNTDSFGNTYFSAAIAAGNYPITLNTPTHVLVAGAGGIISRVATSQLISNTDVTSVFGRTGAILPLPGDYNTDMVKEETNLYFSNSRARAALSLTTTGSTGPATYNALTGVINIPQYQNDFNGVSSFNTRTGAVTLTALDVTTALTYTPVAVETDPIWAAQKVLYYTKVESDATFALVGHTHTTTQVTEGTNLYFTNTRARAAISLTTTGTSGAATYINGVFNIPNYTTDLTGYATETYVNTQVSNLVDAAPTTLNTLNELAAALGDDANFSTTITTLIGTKEPAIIPGTTAQYWRGDKTWQTLPTYDLSLYVPYTGATANVNLGLYGLTTRGLTISKAGSSVNGLIFEQAAGLGIDGAGFTTIGPSGSDGFGFYFGGTTQAFILKASSITSQRAYTMPNASGTIALTSDIVSYTLPTASTTVLGGIKVDGVTITIDANGVISGANTYVLPTATATVLGGVKIGTGVTITSGVISVSTDYEPPITAGTTAQYWRGDKSWQTLPIYTLAGLGGLPLAGGIMTGAITLKEGAANGLKFPNDIFGGSGDTAGMRLITRAGESMSLEVYLTNDADDWFNISVPNDSAAKVNGNTIWHAGNLVNFTRTVSGLVPNPGGSTTNRYLREDGTWVIPPDTDTVYVHPTTAGNKHIPAGGSAGQILRYSSDGTAVWGADNDTTYVVFTRSANGLAPAAPAGTGTTRYLREDGTWSVPPDTDTDTNTWNANTKDVAGYVAAPGAVANKVWKTDANGNPAWRDDADTDTNTWNANTRDVAGYVSAPGAVANKVWKTDASGNPGWRDDADTDTNTTYTAGAGLTLTGTSFSVTKTITASETADTIALRNGSGQLVATGFFQASSRTLKTNINPFTKSALDIIREVSVVSFNYKTDVINKHIGFIAEDTPEELSTRNKNVMDSNNTIGVLLKAVQELEAKVKELEAKYNEK